MKKNKSKVFEWSLNTLDRNADFAAKKIVKSGRGWRTRLTDVSIISFGFIMKEKGKVEFTASAVKIHKDINAYLSQFGESVGLRTIERRIAELKKTSLIVIQQGYIILNKSINKVIKKIASVYSLNRQGIEKALSVSRGYFKEVKKTVSFEELQANWRKENGINV